MIWKTLKPPESIESASGRAIRFVGETDGAAERELKRQLRESFTQNPNVKAAYLSRVSYGSSSDESTAICVRTEIGADKCVIKATVRIVDAVFGGRGQIEVIFIDSAQEVLIRKRCSPFFGARPR